MFAIARFAVKESLDEALDGKVGLQRERRGDPLARLVVAAELRRARGHEREMTVARGADPFERLERFGVLLRAEQGAPQQMRARRRAVRVEAHGRFQPLDGLDWLAEPGQNLALLRDQARIVRIHGECPIVVQHGLVELSRFDAHLAQEAVALDVVLVQRHGLVDLFPGLHEELLGRIAEAALRGLSEGAGLPGVGLRELRVECDRLVEQAQRLVVVLRGGAVMVDLAGEQIVECRHVARRLAAQALGLGGAQASGQRRDDRRA